MWYVGLGPKAGLLLVALPLTVLCLGSVTLLGTTDVELRHAAYQMLAMLRRHTATVFVAAATLMAAGVLAIVSMHMLTN